MSPIIENRYLITFQFYLKYINYNYTKTLQNVIFSYKFLAANLVRFNTIEQLNSYDATKPIVLHVPMLFIKKMMLKMLNFDM